MTTKIRISTFVTSLLLSFHSLSTSSINQPLYQTETIEARAGIFYHQIGQAKISHDYLTLLSYTNISVYERKLKTIHSTFQGSVPLCKTPKIFNRTSQDEFMCNERLELFQYEIKNINDKFDSLSHLTTHKPADFTQRVKRGLFDGVSYAFKWLFGVPDAEDAKHYADAIESISQQNHNMQVLMKQQIHIMTDAISEYNKTSQALYLNEQKINENFGKFNKFAKDAVMTINSLTFVQTRIDHLNLLSQLIDELNEELDIIISSILFAKQNVLHPSVITPEQLHHELSKIRTNTNFELPINNDNIDNIHKYLQICQLSVIYADKNLIYAIKIPLVTKELYQLYNLIPLPIKSPNSTSVYSYINPTFPYLLLSTTRSFYAELRDLSTCKWSPPSDYICSHTTTHLIKERPTCETDLKIHRSTSIPKSCSTKTIKSEMEIWHPLSPNQWLYVLTQPTVGTISCDDNTPVTDFTLQGNGILKLRPKCKCYTLSTLLVATSDIIANFTHFIPSIDIINDDCCQREREFLQSEEMNTLKLSDLNLNDLRHTQHKLEQFEEELQYNMNQPYLVQKSKWYNVLLGIIATLMTILLFCCGLCRCCRWRPFNWFRRFFRPDNCKYMVCINSHNTVSHNDLSSWDTHRSLRDLQGPSEHLNLTEGTPLRSLDPVYTEVLNPTSERKNRRFLKI